MVSAQERINRTAGDIVRARVQARQRAEQQAQEQSQQQEAVQEEKYVVVGEERASKNIGKRETILAVESSAEAARARAEEKVPIDSRSDTRGRSIYYGLGYDNIFIRKVTTPVQEGQTSVIAPPLTKQQEQAQRGKNRGLVIHYK